jgi:sporulation protein YlmC with PRC-barrel domain
MKITFKQNEKDINHPVMHGDTPLAKEFNKRQKEMFKAGRISIVNFEQITTVLLDILVDDYNTRNAKK